LAVSAEDCSFLSCGSAKVEANMIRNLQIHLPERENKPAKMPSNPIARRADISWTGI
jgi:hypothetical protein